MNAPRTDAPLVAEAVAKGLARVDLMPAGHGFLDVTAGISSTQGAFAQGEVGFKPRENIDLFGFGRWTPGEASAGVGARLIF